MSTGGLELSVATPGNWLTVEPDAFADRTAVEGMVEGRIDEIPELAPHRSQLLESVVRTLGRARQDGVVHCAVLVDLTETKQPLLANLTVVVTPAPPPDPERGDLPRIAEIEDALADHEPDVTQREVNSMLLPGGPAMRIARMIDLPLAGEGEGTVSITVLSVQYFFAVPGEDAFVVLNFSSPSIGAHLRLQSLFHDIAAEFRFVGGDGAAAAG